MTAHGATFASLSTMLNPRSIAVIGASDEPGNLGGTAVGYLQHFGYPGTVFPVNPKRTTVMGLPCHPSVADLPEVPELVVFAVSARVATSLVPSVAAAGVRYGVLWAGGFAEVGGEGVSLQRQLVETCHENGFAMLGPNCIGFINTGQPSVASFASFLAESDGLPSGTISMVSQSGGLGTQAQAIAQRSGGGFRLMVSTGNEAVLTVSDFINAFAEDEQTRVIAVYLEGIRDPERLVAALSRAREADKPVVVLKGGAVPASARAATAHTGALTGEDRVLRAVFAELGVLPVDSLEQLLDVSLLLASTPARSLPADDRAAVVTFGGGMGVIAADQAAAAGLRTPPLAEQTTKRLAELAPPIASLANPADLTPQTYNDTRYLTRFGDTLRTIADDPEVDVLLALYGPMSVGAPEVIEATAELRDSSDTMVCVAWPLAPRGAVEGLRERGFHVFEEPAHAISSIASVLRYSRARTPIVTDDRPLLEFDWAAFVPEPAPDLVLTEERCHALLAAAGVPVAAGRFLRSGAELDETLRTVGLPVVMKGISPQVLHRDAAGLVRVGIDTADAAVEAYRQLRARAVELDVPLDGVYVQAMASGTSEILVSAFRDPMFGVMVSVGAGGTLTELIDDVALARAPFGPRTAADLLDRLRVVSYARRKGRDAGLPKLAEVVSHFSGLAAGAPWRRFVLEVNPIRVGPSGVVAVDGLLIVEEP